MRNKSDEILLFEENREKLKEAKRIFNQYKELRSLIGEPAKSPFDPDVIKKNLGGEDFLSVIKEIEKEGGEGSGG